MTIIAMTIDLIHAMAMVIWGIGLPLLIWHRYPRLSRAYMWYSLTFIVITLLSHWIWGQCFLTVLARVCWNAAGIERTQVPFTVLLVNKVAGIRPSTRVGVLIWEFAVLISCIGNLWYWYKNKNGIR